MTIYEQWGLTPIINASGSVTRLGGAPMPPEVLQAFCDAAAECVPLDQLHAVASRFISEVTGAEAGLVTSGAAASLLLGTAAILTGYDVRRIEKLPNCEGFPHEFVVAREQRNGYDHAVRAAGAKLVEIGFHEMVAGAGVRRAEAWEYEAALGPETAGVLYVLTDDSCPPLAEVVAVAHRRQLPVLVDAAGSLPPRDKLRAILATGADLVCFSGGKAIRGPQATGLLCGRRDLVGSAALQMLDLDDHESLWEPPLELIDRSQLKGMPRHGIGRALKVSKEQIVALLTALRLFTRGTYDDELPAMQQRLERISASLAGKDVQTHLFPSADGQSYPMLEITVPESRLGHSAFEFAKRLRHGHPPVYVGHSLLPVGKLVIHPLHLSDEKCELLIQRLREEL
jgi:D-glucosaminate-6-phosphate ammonia-lyase